jgi:hypothetical protein
MLLLHASLKECFPISGFTFAEKNVLWVGYTLHSLSVIELR